MGANRLSVALALVLVGGAGSGCRHGGWIVPFAFGVAVAESAHQPGPPPSDYAPAREADEVDPGAPGEDDAEDDAEAPPPEALPRPAALDPAAAERELSPYGRWVDTPEYGRVWIPAAADGDWQPYADGHWVWTSYGWSFVAGVPWGGIVFHYGRWGWADDWGWFWVPGYVWAPAWVSWRWHGAYCSWSALGPRGYRYGRHWPGWVTVPHQLFGTHVLHARLPHASAIVRASRPIHPPGRASGGRSGGGRRR